MRIIYERSGGFMGLKSGLTIDLNNLPSAEAEILRGLVAGANFFALPENSSTRSTADGFQYAITVETETVKHTVRTSDGTLPEELRPLLHELSQRARSQRRQ
jgi:hypothetical protein